MEGSNKRLYSSDEAEHNSSRGSHASECLEASQNPERPPLIKASLLEMGSLVLAAALVGIVAVLFVRVDGHPTPDWV